MDPSVQIFQMEMNGKNIRIGGIHIMNVRTKKKAGSVSSFDRLLILLLCCLMLIPCLRFAAVSTEASTAWPSFQSGRPVRSYTINSEKKYQVYDKNHKKIKGRSVKAADILYLVAVKGKWATVQYPYKGKRKTGYIPLSVFTSATAPQSKKISRAEATTYRRSSGSKTLGRVGKGSTIYTMTSSGSRVQIIYSVKNKSGGIRYWQMAWVSRADYTKMTTVTTPSKLRITGVSRPTTLPEGSPFSCVGTILSNYRIKEVRVAVRNAAYETVSRHTAYPNSYSFSLGQIDDYIRFDHARAGKNLYIIWAKDEKKSVMMTIPFTVKSSSSANTPSSGSGGGSSYVLGYASYKGVNYKSQTSDRRRIKALDKARKMVTVKWKCPLTFPTWYNSEGYYSTTKSTDGTVSNKFLKGKTYVGIPFSMVDHSYDDDDWNRFIRNGYTWNDIAKPYYSYTNKTTAKGSDCSYFVYQCMKAAGANVTYQTTYMMYNGQYYTRIDKSRLKPGDILLISHHVRMFAGRVGSKYAVFEEAGEGSRTRYKLFSSSELFGSGYQAYRYKHW